MPEDLGPQDFEPFFRAIHGTAARPRPAPWRSGPPPFAWQQALLEQVLTGRWPDVIDIPTGLGKTAVVDVAVFALAAQAHLPVAERTAPLRTFMVVDRRVIVDQTHERALVLSEALMAPDAPEPVRRVAEALRRLSVGTASPSPLEVVRMRGGTTWSARWLASPAQPAVVTGTVDQLGSRLLFRGYGVSPNRRPIDAALCGVDSLLILDEAHLSTPFVQTVSACHEYEGLATDPVLDRRARPVLLSATPPQPGGAAVNVFRLDPEAETSDTARARLGAERHLHLVDLISKAKPEQALVQLAEALAAVAGARLSDAGVKRVAVVCNTVGLARLVHEHLEGAVAADVALVTGRCRPIDRERIAEQWLDRLSPEDRVGDEKPIVVVATQTIEVGADLDVDALVTEVAPLDTLLQRLGRLDRRGRHGPSHAHVVHANALHEGAETMVYGEATGRTWEWLCTKAGSPGPVSVAKLPAVLGQPPWLDLGYRSQAALLSPNERMRLCADVTEAPVILSPVLDGWARTSPSPEPDQEVAPFLHGVAGAKRMVSVCWRAGLPPPKGSGFEAWQEELRLTPPGSAELVEVPLREARAFLRGEPLWVGSDLEGDLVDDDDPFDERQPPDAVVFLPDGTVEPAGAGGLRPGVTLVLPASAGGHDAWGWTGRSGDFVVDVADLGSGRPRLRRRQAVLDALLGDVAPRVGTTHLDEDAVSETPEAFIRRVITACAGATVYDGWLGGRLVERLGSGRRWKEVQPKSTEVGQVLIAGYLASSEADRSGRGIDRAGRALLDDVDDTDVGASSGGSAVISLDRHLSDVQDRSRSVANSLGLSAALIGAVALAGRLHDLGKADERFQVMLHRGDRLRFEASGQLLAKSGMDPADRASFRAARRRSGWPVGMRHEAVSVAFVDVLADEAPEMFAELDLDLVRHLVVSHHGYARPLLPPVSDRLPEEVRVRFEGLQLRVKSNDVLIDWGGPSRFDRLCRTYGRWGLALLESVVRLADIAWSIEYQGAAAAEAEAEDATTDDDPGDGG